MNTHFEYADKQKIQEILPVLFDILHSNMSVIAPTGNTYEVDMEEWLSNIIPAMQKQARQIILMYIDGSLVGYFQYYINADSLMMEEIQIVKEYHSSGLFGSFYHWMVSALPKDIKYVEAYSNKKNYKSQGILEHLGLLKKGENKSGNSFYYKGDYINLLKKYN